MYRLVAFIVVSVNAIVASTSLFSHADPSPPSVGVAPTMPSSAPPGAALPNAVPIDITELFVSRVGNDYMNCLTFKNVSVIPIQAIDFVFSYLDAFGRTTQSENERDGTFSPNAIIQGPTKLAWSSWNKDNKQNCWTLDNVASPLLTSVSVSVGKVTYANGTTWTNPNSTTSSATEQIDVTELGLPKDMQTVALARGRPCYVTESDTAGLGHMDQWYYNCLGPGLVGRECYTFLDGRLIQHVSY